MLVVHVGIQRRASSTEENLLLGRGLEESYPFSSKGMARLLQPVRRHSGGATCQFLLARALTMREPRPGISVFE